jgi:salicylate hydroxylase
MKVVVVGAGIGGLACAIACRRQGLDVIVLERAAEILLVSRMLHVGTCPFF